MNRHKPISCKPAPHFVKLLMAATLIIASIAQAATLPADHAERMTRGLKLFQTEINSILKENCLRCHGGEKTKGDLDLTTREDALRGGKDGAVIVPFDAGRSLLVELINHAKEPPMPDKKPKLGSDTIAKITAWINDGAPYGDPLIAGRKPKRDPSKVSDDDRQWWAFKPLSAPAVDSSKGTNPIDQFLLAKAKGSGFAFSPPADPRTLVRRMYLDLTGIPPTPEEVKQFEQEIQDNKIQDARVKGQPSGSSILQSCILKSSIYSRWVDKVLASPRYGERWARHWLDVARFAESSGFEHDYDRPFAFHYRDFVIKALNQDMPYDQFVKWQLAGDEYDAGNPLALAATGFLGAGVFPTQITANEVERTRYDALDDMLSTTGSAMLGLSLGCARCHDHKYDPIPTRDYYRMLSTFTTTVRSNIDVNIESEKTRVLKAAWEQQLAKIATAVKTTEKNLRPKFEQWLHSGLKDAGADSWTLLQPTELKSQAKATFKSLGDGSYLVEGENAPHDVYTITAPTTQKHITALRLETLTHPSMKGNGPGRAANGNFGLSKITVSIAPATEVKIARAFATHEQNKTSLSIAASLDEDPGSGWAVDGQIGKDQAAVFVFDQPLDLPEGAKLTIKLSFSVNTQHNIGRPRFSVTSAAAPRLEGGALSAPVAAAMQKAREGGKLAHTEEQVLFDWWKQREPAWLAENAKLADHQAKEPRSMTTMMICGEGYPPLVMHSQGAPFFDSTYILKRGNPDLKDGVADQGFLQVLSRASDTKPWQWQPPTGAKFSGRRRSFSNWITDVDHGAGALLARVMVNRLWQHHFGTGIVSTPSDFGKQGAPPSQPELLDWLAGELIRNGWKLKPLHQLIMSSAAYQQSCQRDAAKEAADPANALFMRRLPQRLEAEAIRDSMLAVSGLLDETMFGPGARDEMGRRRSIYFNIKRSQLIGSMVAFDAPEPLSSQGARPTTTVTPQALMLMNSPQARACAEALALRVSTNGDVRQQIARAYTICFGRAPGQDETSSAEAFIRSQSASYASDKKPDLAFADFCQVLLGLNEFVYVN